jgi:hypothetical protein
MKKKKKKIKNYVQDKNVHLTTTTELKNLFKRMLKQMFT